MNESDDEPASRFASGILLAIAGTFLFALKSIFIKMAFAEGAEPAPLLLLRLVIALPFYVAVLCRVRFIERGESIRRRDVVRAIGLGFLGYYLASYLDLSGLQHITAQLERLTLFIYPAIIAVLAWLFLGERMTRRIVMAILFCYSGVALMYGKERAISDSTHVTWGVALVGASAISYAVYVLLAKQAMKRIGSRQFTSLAMIGSTVFMAIHFAVRDDWSALGSMQPVVYVYGLVLAIICTLLPSFMINEAIMRIGAIRTAVIGSVGPVLTMLLAIAVLNEASSPEHFAGMTIAIFGVSLVTRK